MTARDLLAVLVLLVLLAGLTVPVVLTDRVYLPRHPEARDLPWSRAPGRPGGLSPAEEPFNHAFSDKINLLYPDIAYGQREARAGHFPEWNPLILGGLPHAANPLTGVFYPPNWLLLLVDVTAAPLVSAAFHLFLLGFFFFLFLRVAGCGPAAALTGALAATFSGWVAAHLQNTPLVAVVSWIPLGLFAIESRLRRHGRWSLMLLSLSVAMMWVAGMPQLALLGTLALALYAVTGLVARVLVDRSSVVRDAGGLLVFALLGLLLASVQILPTLELSPHTGHQERSAQDLVSERMKLGAWAGLVLPRFLGEPTVDADPDEHWGARLLLGDGPGLKPRPNWSERTVYAGILVVLLALIGILRARDRVRWTLVGLGAMGVLMASSATVIRLLSHVPFFDVGAPVRAVFIPALVIAALAGFGFQGVVDGIRAGKPRMRKGVLLTLTGLVGICALFILWGWAHEESCLGAIVGLLKAAGVEDRLAAGTTYTDQEYLQAFTPAFADLRRDAGYLCLWLSLGVMLLWLRRRRPTWGFAVLGAMAALMVIELLVHFIPVNLPVSREAVFRETAGLQFLRENLGADRFIRVSPDAETARRELHHLFQPNLGMLFGLADAQGYREQVPRWYLELWRGVAAVQNAVGISGVDQEQVESPVLDLARVRYLVSSSELTGLEERLAFPRPGEPGGGLWIYENPGRLPHAYVVHKARCLPDKEARELIREGTVDLREEVVVHQWPSDDARTAYPVSEGVDQVTLEKEGPGTLLLSVDARGSGYLVVTDTWFPGWKATITRQDGVPRDAPIVRAMTAFRAVPIEAGPQTIRLEYVSWPLHVGGILAGLGWIGFLLLPLVRAPAAVRRRSRSTPRPALEGSDRPSEPSA